MVRPAIGEAVYQPGIAVEGEDHRLVPGEQGVEGGVREAMGMEYLAGLEAHEIDHVHHPNLKIRQMLT